jgi:hypothetical protein
MDKIQWNYTSKTHLHAGKKIKHEVWRHTYKPIFMTVDNAWLGRGYMREGYVIHVKRNISKETILERVAFTKKDALKIAKQIRDNIDAYPSCQCNCKNCLTGEHCHGLVCRGD